MQYYLSSEWFILHGMDFGRNQTENSTRNSSNSYKWNTLALFNNFYFIETEVIVLESVKIIIANSFGTNDHREYRRIA